MASCTMGPLQGKKYLKCAKQSIFNKFFSFRFAKGKPIISFGTEFYIIPAGFGELMVNAMTKMYNLTRKSGKRKIYNHLNLAWKNKRKDLWVSCFSRAIPEHLNQFIFFLQSDVEKMQRKPGASPMWDLLMKNEIAGKRIIDIPAPLKGDKKAMLEYCKLFADPVGKAYKAWELRVRSVGGNPQEEAQLVFAKGNRNADANLRFRELKQQYPDMDTSDLAKKAKKLAKDAAPADSDGEESGDEDDEENVQEVVEEDDQDE